VCPRQAALDEQLKCTHGRLVALVAANMQAVNTQTVGVKQERVAMKTEPPSDGQQLRCVRACIVRQGFDLLSPELGQLQPGAVGAAGSACS
jgi:hypothetical protein